MTLEEKYPLIQAWIGEGEINIGRTNSYHPAACVLDEGGVIWETNDDSMSLDEILDAMEQAIGRWCLETEVEFVDRSGNVIPVTRT